MNRGRERALVTDEEVDVQYVSRIEMGVLGCV
jgi:hypothetical protein